MKKLLLILTLNILIFIAGCTKKDNPDEEYIPTLTSIDISGAKFLFSSGKIQETNEFIFSKVSTAGIKEDIDLIDEKNSIIDRALIFGTRFIFSLDEYVGISIDWEKSKVVGNMHYSTTRIFYLVKKSDGTVAASLDITESGTIEFALKYCIDPDDNIYYLGNNSVLYKFRWNNTADVSSEQIATNVDDYIISPNGDLAYIKTENSYPVFYFRFADGSQMTLKSARNINVSSGILELGLSNNGKFCAYYKNNSNEYQIRIYTDLGGERNFWFCNSSPKPIYKFYLAGGKLWGIHINGDYTDFFNFSECGSFTEHSVLLMYDTYRLKQSPNYFYYFNKQTKTIDRFLPGTSEPVTWATLPSEPVFFGADCTFSSDDYSIIQAYYSSPEPGNHSKIFCTDNSGKILFQMAGGIQDYVVL